MEDLLLVLPTVWEMQGVCQALSYAVARAVCSLGRGSWEPGTRGLLGHQQRGIICLHGGEIFRGSVCAQPCWWGCSFSSFMQTPRCLIRRCFLCLCRGCLLPLEEAPAFGAGFCCPPAPLQCITATANLVTARTIAWPQRVLGFTS